MARDVTIIIEEMIDVIDHLKAGIKHQDYESFQKDWILRHAAQRALEIISEASRHLPDDLRATEPDVDWAQIRAIGNLLRHEYHRTSDKIIWKTATQHLDDL